MIAAKKKPLLMTEGALFGKILIFILPLMATNLLQTLYNAADMVIVGLSAEADAVGAVGVTSSFINLVINIFMGFATGANVMVARHLGARDEEHASRTVHTAIAMSVAFGALAAIIGLIISRPVLALMGTTAGKLLDLATRYCQIYFAGAPAIALTNYLIAIFRAKGDTKTPLIILSVAGLINVVFNLFFVLVLQLSVEGVALATTLSNIVSAILLLLKLAHDKGACRFSLKRLCLDRHALRSIIYIGLPAGIQGSLFSISNMLIQSSILQVNNALAPTGSAYQPVVKGNAAAGNLEGFIYTAQNSVYQASITFTSQNVGAAKYERVRRVMLCCYLISFIVAAAFGLGMYLLRAPLLALYDVMPGAPGTLSALAYDAACSRMLYLFIPYFMLAWMEAGCGAVRGLGKSLSSTFISLVGACLFRIAWICTVFRANPTLEIIYLSYPISWALTAIAQLICAVAALKHLIKTRRNAQEIHALHPHHEN